ncbi:HEAT repeat domain-containing protein [[Phormidium] sp. ETS-05]|uniref:HEAT repeat domain-containing protein n=1 Tax=[Phormidium] sp. ETS-05 TaxID=222819 RepID=UPI0018EF114D|nr:HEAT repeat domain-containing protein [[Phormidium] sp. ETS-05]
MTKTLCQAHPVLGMNSYPPRLLFLITSFCLSLAPTTTGANTLTRWEVSPNIAAPEVRMWISALHTAATTDNTPHLGGVVKREQVANGNFILASATRPGIIAQNSEPKKTSSQRRWLPLLLLSLATITGAAIFAGVFYLLTRSGGSDEELDAEPTTELQETGGDSAEVETEKRGDVETGLLGANGHLPPQGILPEPETGGILKGDQGTGGLGDGGSVGSVGSVGPTAAPGVGSNLPPPLPHPPTPPHPPVSPSPSHPVTPSPRHPVTPSPGLPITPPPLPLEANHSIPEPDMMQELIRSLYSADASKRRQAIWELGWRGDSRSAQPLVDLMLNSDSKQRSLILAALSEIGTRTLTPLERALAISLQDRNPDVRKNAIRDLTRIYESIGHISQMLRLAVEDSDPEVQETARWALEQLGRLRTHASGNNRTALPTWTVPEDNSPEEIP